MYSTQFVRPQGYAQRVLEKNTECKEKLCFQENSTDTFKAGNSVVCLKLFFFPYEYLEQSRFAVSFQVKSS